MPIELTPDARLLRRKQVETPQGLRDQVDGLTERAPSLLDRKVRLAEGVTLATLLDLIKGSPELQVVYRGHWIAEYLQRYEDIRAGRVGVKRASAQGEASDDAIDHDRRADEPPIEALLLRPMLEIGLPMAAFNRIAKSLAEREPHVSRKAAKTSDLYLSLLDAPADIHASMPSHRWDLTGRSRAFEQDTQLHGMNYKAGESIHYSVSTSFDECIDLPIEIRPGAMELRLEISPGDDGLHDFSVTIPMRDEGPQPMITLGELLHSVFWEFSFHGGPQEAQAFRDELRQQSEEWRSEEHAEDRVFGMAHVFDGVGSRAPDMNEVWSKELGDTDLYWTRERVLGYTGWSAEELDRLVRQGRALELDARATATAPSRTGYPVAQFHSDFDRELLRYILWIGSLSCSDWSTHRFLSERLVGDLSGWEALRSSGQALSLRPIADEDCKVSSSKKSPLRPTFEPGSPKDLLVQAFEAYARERRRAAEGGG